MKDDKTIMDFAIFTANRDSRQKKVASEVLEVLANNNTTISEATQILKTADQMIANARLARQRALTPVPPNVPDVD